MVRRIILSGLGIVPAVLAKLGVLSILAVPVGWVLAVTASLIALVMSVKRKILIGEKATRMLLPAALAEVQAEMPSVGAIRVEVQEALSKQGSEDGLPPFQDAAIAASLTHLLSQFKTQNLDEINRTNWSELYALKNLLQSEPGQAAKMAANFKRPDLVLNLRDTIIAQDKARRHHEAQSALFQAAIEKWHTPGRVLGRSPMTATLKSLPCPDIDLWHHILLTHDPMNKDQSAAAFWCLQQADCDRASVAAYLSRIAIFDHLHLSVLRGDMDFIHEISALIERWNNGFYRKGVLALAPPDSVLGSGPVLATALDKLAEHTNSPRLDEPTGVFVEYHGRDPMPRDFWCLSEGRPHKEPSMDHFEIFDQAAA